MRPGCLWPGCCCLRVSRPEPSCRPTCCPYPGHIHAIRFELSIDARAPGLIKIFGETKEAAEAARQRVLGITAEAEIGKIYVGKVERIVDFGAFVNILPGKDGLVHISMLSDARVEKVTDILKEGQEVEVLVLDVDNRGRIKLSIKDVAAAKASGV